MKSFIDPPSVLHVRKKLYWNDRLKDIIVIFVLSYHFYLNLIKKSSDWKG